MARVTAGQADLIHLPVAYTKGHDKPIGWHKNARCIEENMTVRSDEGGWPPIWQVEGGKMYTAGDRRVKGSVLIEVALTHCSLCSAQWDCASFAVSVPERFGTWGMTIDELERLQRMPDPERIIRRAEKAGVPVQFAVRDTNPLA